MSMTNLFRNIGGEPEIGRVLLFAGAAVAIVSPVAFEAWQMAKGGDFDVTAWCLAYPGGLAALISGGVVSVGRKEKSVAEARKTTQGDGA